MCSSPDPLPLREGLARLYLQYINTGTRSLCTGGGRDTRLAELHTGLMVLWPVFFIKVTATLVWLTSALDCWRKCGFRDLPQWDLVSSLAD